LRYGQQATERTPGPYLQKDDARAVNSSQIKLESIAPSVKMGGAYRDVVLQCIDGSLEGDMNEVGLVVRNERLVGIN
jgi:hypothetical protein